MRRYSEKFLLRNPHLRGKDIETTATPARSFATYPPPSSTSWGTRFTDQKREAARSRYRHLMPPRRRDSPSPWQPWAISSTA